jgi:hypothetical protein
MSLPPSFDNLVTSLESMSTKYDLQFIVPRLLHEVSKRKESESTEMLHCLTEFIGQMKNFVFIAKNPDIL